MIQSTDIIESNKLEWEGKDRTEREMIAVMRQTRMEYDIKLADLLETSSKKKKMPKLIEPPLVDENTVIDCTVEHKELEEKLTKEILQALHPDYLGLSRNEV